jgi:HEAT repeat protein
MAGFFQDKDPIVRYAAVSAANPSVDLISRRLLYAAVNDASEEVRFAALTKLLTTEGSALKEALKGVRDESPWLRIRLLNWIGNMGNPSHMPAIRHGIADSIPLVRSSALVAWLRFETPPTLEDLTPALKDPDPRVQAALIQVSRRFNIVLGEEAKRLLRESIDPAVREASQELP